MDLTFTLDSKISIHALARRATPIYTFLNMRVKISIHALARRATENPLQRNTNLKISIHALARRATKICFYVHWQIGNFNPRSRKESDTTITDLTATVIYFNPRSRKESDDYSVVYSIIGKAFQSTLSQGERHLVLRHSPFVMLFQSTLSQGERRALVAVI